MGSPATEYATAAGGEQREVRGGEFGRRDDDDDDGNRGGGSVYVTRGEQTARRFCCLSRDALSVMSRSGDESRSLPRTADGGGNV